MNQYHRDNFDIEGGFHHNKSLIFMANWYPKINNICWRMLGITITIRITNLTNSTIISTNQ